MKNTILIVDDTQMYQTTLASIVEKLGFEAVTCGDGAEAIPLLGIYQGQYAAVLLDVYMPLLDGISVLGHIRNKWPALPVIVISGTDDKADEESVQQLGVLGFLKKSLPASALRAELEALLSPLLEKDVEQSDKNTASSC